MCDTPLNADISATILNRVSDTYKTFGMQIVRKLANKFGFDPSDAVEAIGLEKLKVGKSSVSKSKKDDKETKTKEPKTKEPKATKAPKPTVPLPFVGVVDDDNCKGIKLNHMLHTQCEKKPKKDSEYCAICQKQADGNASGKPNMGDIRDRLECDLLEYVDPKNRKTLPYINVINKLNLDIDVCKEEAKTFGVEIPDCHFEVRETRKGRPAKKTDDNDGESVKTSSTGEKKKRGRPCKSKDKEVESVVGDDLLTALSASCVSKDTDKKEKKTQQKKKQTIKKEKDVTEVEDSEPEQEQEPEKETVKEPKQQLSNFKKITIDGVKYLIDGELRVFDIVTKELVGLYDRKTKQLFEVETSDSDEDSGDDEENEDEYETEDETEDNE